MTSSAKSSFCKRCAMIMPLFFLLLHFATAQDTSVAGEWNIAVGPNQNPILIELTDAGLTLKATIADNTIVFSGRLSNDSITASSPIERGRWGDSQKPCHDRIVSSIQSYPQYRLTLKLKRAGESWRGSLQLPEKISCETGTPAITLGHPTSVSLRRPSALYWISGKQILKTRTADIKENLPLSQSVLVTGADNITSVALDRNASRVYWSEGRFIYSVQQDGRMKQTLTRAALAQSPPNNLVIAAESNRIFWVEGIKILSSLLHANQREVIRQEQQAPASLAVDVVNRKLYWLLAPGKIRRSNFDGTLAEDYFSDAAITSFTINSAAGFLYYTSNNGIRRLHLSEPGAITTIQADYTEGKRIAADERFEQLYWSQNNSIYKARLDGTGSEGTKINTAELGNFVIGPLGPTEYDRVEILGQLVIAEAFPGKSLLQLLAKNDTYYQVILSRSQRNESEFNLTDARLILIWGKNFPRITYKGNNVQLNSKSPFIRYAEFTNWCELLLERQKEVFSGYPLWLMEANGLKERTWETAIQVVRDSLGQAGVDMVKSKDRMLVLAIPGMGVYPGMQSFTMNDAEAEWYLPTGSTRAAMRFARQLEQEDESLSNLYSSDAFFIEIKAEKAVDAERIELSYFVNDLPLEVQMMEAIASADKKTFRTPPIRLKSRAGQAAVYTGFDGVTEISCAAESILKVAVSNKSWFNNGNPTYAMAKLIDPKVDIWHQTLGEAISLSHLTIPETKWESKADTVLKTFSSVDLAGLGIQQCAVSLGDYAAMLLLKKYFVRQMQALKESLEKNKNEKGFQYGFWESMAASMEEPDFPLGDLEVTDDEVELRNAFTREYILNRFSTPGEAKGWIEKAKAEGFSKYLLSIDKSLNTATNTLDTDIEAMMNLTGFGFNAMIEQVSSDMMEKEYSELDEGCSGETPYGWIPDRLARAHVRTMCITAEHCKANDELQAAGTDVALAAASLLVFPIGAYFSYGKLAAGIYSAALGSGELARDHLQFKAEDRELEFAAGTAAVLGSQRYTLAKLQVTPTWARMLSYFGGAAGILGDASDIVKNINRVDMSAAYRQLPSMANKVNEQGALKAFEAMSSADKSRFLLLLGEAETLKKLPADQLNDAQRKLVQMAEQFETQIDAAARARTAVTEAAEAGGESVADLRRDLTPDLKDNVPLIKDDKLSGNTVELRYDLDKNGFVTNIRIAAGPSAKANHIQEHIPALKKMMEYQKVSGAASGLYQRIRYWYRSIVGGEPPIGSPAWESMQEVQKLNFIVESRLSDLSRGLGGINPAVLTEEIQSLTRQLAEQQRAFENFITDPALRRGFVAATSERQIKALETMKKKVEDLAKITQKSSSTQLTAKSRRLQQGIDLLSKPANKAIYDKFLQVGIQSGDPALAARLIENLTFVDGITPAQLRAINSFLDAVKDGGTSMAIILQRARHNTDEVKRILNEVNRLSSNADALKGMDVFIQQIDPGAVGTVSRLDEFIIERKAWNTGTNNEVANILETIYEFRNHRNFRQVILNLSKKSDTFSMEDEIIEGFSTNSYRGAVAQLCAARELSKKFGFKPEEIFFEMRIGNDFRFVDIMVKKDGKIRMLVECKEYTKLQNLTKDDIVRQFAKDILIAKHRGISVRNGVRWMINKQALVPGNSTISLTDLQEVFLEGLENNELIKELCCSMKIKVKDGRELFRTARAQLDQNMGEIFIPF